MGTNKLLLVLLMSSLTAALAGTTVIPKPKREYFVYVGTYTGNNSKGIYAYRFNSSTGKADSIGLVAETANPSFLAVHPNQRFLYAVNEVSDFEGKSGYVSAFSIDARTGHLNLINKVSSGGADPCHLAVDKSGKWLFVANYSGGSLSLFPIKESGELGTASIQVQHNGSSVNQRRQEGPHVHSVNLSSDNRILLVCDLGLDKIMIYRFDAGKGTLKLNDPSFVKLLPGSGPRHLSFHPGGRLVYLINELDSTLTAFAYNPERGSLREIQTLSTLPLRFEGASITAEVEVHPDGKYVYGSNRGHDSIAVFAIQGKEGSLKPVEHVPTQGKTPRQFAIDPTGSFLFAANQNSDEIVLFRIDRKTGRLTSADTVLKTPLPVCVLFVRPPG
jgi:6-phosphogluconolactonase